MPVTRLEGRAPRWLVSGRVLVRTDDAATLIDGSDDLVVVGDAVRALEAGDLVRATCAVDGAADVHARAPRFRALSVERLFRPTRPVFTAGSETGRVLRGLRDTLDARARAFDRVRGFFRNEGFVEVETPSVAACPGLDPHLAACDVSDPDGAVVGHLITSPEYHMKRLLVGGVARCFQLARCWRAGELGARHQPEFTMLEWYRAWQGLDAVLDDTECVVRAVASAVGAPSWITANDLPVSLARPFERMTVREAFARFAPDLGDPIALAERDEVAYYEAISLRIEPELGATRPTFLTRFPARHASLAKVCPDDPSVCERAELYIAGVELSNGFHELTDPVEQRRRFEADQRTRAERGLAVYPIDEAFLAALDEGMPPSAGNALGLDRLVMIALGRRELGEVMAFPRATR